MFYKTTHCTLSGLIAGVKLYPPIQMMLTNSESGRKCRTQTNFKFLKFKFFSGLAGGGSFGGFSSGFCEEDVWFEFEEC